jgi:hypothetical protein
MNGEYEITYLEKLSDWDETRRIIHLMHQMIGGRTKNWYVKHKYINENERYIKVF